MNAQLAMPVLVDDLSDLVEEPDALPELVTDALLPEPCRCDRPWANAEGGCGKCGHALLGPS